MATRDHAAIGGSRRVDSELDCRRLWTALGFRTDVEVGFTAMGFDGLCDPICVD